MFFRSTVFEIFVGSTRLESVKKVVGFSPRPSNFGDGSYPYSCILGFFISWFTYLYSYTWVSRLKKLLVGYGFVSFTFSVELVET